MNNLKFIEDIIEKKRKKNIIWENNKFYSGLQFLEKVKYYRHILKKKIQQNSVVAFQSNYNLKSISFFFATILEKLIVIPLPIKQKKNLDLIPCDYFFDLSKSKIIKLKKKNKSNKILKNFKKKKLPGLIVFTSGSSGKPKAILHNFILLLKKFIQIRKGYKTMLMLSFDHLGGINTLFSAILSEEGSAICPQKLDPIYIKKIISTTKAELLPTTPTFLNMMLISSKNKSNELKSLKLITYGAEYMPTELLKKIKKKFPKIKFKQTYGLSEIGVLKSKGSKNSILIKIDSNSCKTKVINDILYIKSQSNMVGYLNAAQPFNKNGWLNTQDRVLQKKNGFLRILGRDSDIINIGGQKVYPQEIENTLMKSNMINDSLVCKIKHPFLGEYMQAEIILKNNHLSEDKNLMLIKNFCKKNLEKYKIPSKFIFLKKNKFVSERFKKMRKNYE